MITILQKNEPPLRAIAKDVPLAQIASERIKKVIGEMKSALGACDDGVALAAPQIGEPLRMFIVSPKAFGEKGPRENEPLAYINPVIKKLSKSRVEKEEGCLSVRHIYGKTQRFSRVTVSAYDENGNQFQRGASGLLAQIFQHEIDHLNGVLFTDRAKDIFKIEPKT